MNNLLSNAFLGLLSVSALFLLCFILVIGIKSTVQIVKNLFPKKVIPDLEEKTPPKAPSKRPRNIKSIVINPDEINRIYVKKT